MLFFFPQEPPPQPQAAVQVVQKAAALGQKPHGSLVGPPKPSTPGAKIDFKKFAERIYVETIVIEGEAEPVDKRPATNQTTLPSLRLIWGRHEQLDLRLVRLAPFWMTNVYGIGHNGFRAGYYPIGWGY
jgi:hypothetical protein